MLSVACAVPGVDHDKVAVVLNGGKKDGTGFYRGPNNELPILFWGFLIVIIV